MPKLTLCFFFFQLSSSFLLLFVDLIAGWSALKTDISTFKMVNSDVAKRQCVNTCALLTTPYNAWLSNQENVNFFWHAKIRLLSRS